MTDLARAFWIAAPGRGELRTESLPAPTAREALVRTLYSGISRGTETLVFAGRVPASEHARMRAPFQAGEFPAPVKYGYCNVGVVERGPEQLRARHVFCLYPHQTRYVVPVAALTPLPDAVPPGRAVLAANLETAVNGLWDAAPRVGDRVAVIGAGTVGCLVAWLAARIAGCEVELIDIDPRKQQAAAALGVAFRTPEQAAREADVVVHTSGSAAGLGTALALAGFEATVLEMSWYGSAAPAVPLGEAFHSRRLTLRSSQVGSIAGAQRARWSHERRMQLVLNLLAHAELDALITGESRFDELPQVLAQLATAPGYTLTHRIVY
ncbi:MAG TPA: zinc-binding alcohol dehydrogenase [Gammaproteobacteria bacterium]|jgi:threonine dehydrogenase-like Zn-dependent dehydrogenase|nr:zinc-binding alcohol dehydrogenase [Gammaproteobacteria bacterium]